MIYIYHLLKRNNFITTIFHTEYILSYWQTFFQVSLLTCCIEIVNAPLCNMPNYQFSFPLLWPRHCPTIHTWPFSYLIILLRKKRILSNSKYPSSETLARALKRTLKITQNTKFISLFSSALPLAVSEWRILYSWKDLTIPISCISTQRSFFQEASSHCIARNLDLEWFDQKWKV